MDYDALLSQVIDLLQREKRVPYRALKRRFDLDDAYIEDLKIDLIEAKQLVVDENDRILVWIGKADSAEAPTSPPAPDVLEPATSPTTEQERANTFIIGKLTNTLGWFHREFDAVSRAVEYDQESIALGRASGVSNVEVSALINLGLDYLARGQHEDALSYLAPTLDRVEREAFGAHRWRWTIRLLVGLAELSYTTGDYDQALRYVDEGLKEAQRTSSQKYVALGWALRGKIIAKLGDTDTAGTELQRAFTLAEQLQSPSLIYPIVSTILDDGTKAQGTNEKRQHCMAEPKRPPSRWQLLSRMKRCARPSCNRHWCKRYTNVLDVWADTSHDL